MLGINDKPNSAAPSLKLDARIFILLFIVIATAAALVTKPVFRPLNLFLTITWALYLPVAVTGLIGAFGSRKLRASQFQGIVSNKVIILIPTVARADTLPALHRVVTSVLTHAPTNLADFRIDVVMDEGAVGIPEIQKRYAQVPHVNLVIVPASFRCANGSRHKARANQYAMEVRRAAGENTSRVFVYHLDDDTAVGPDTIASIAEFIAQDDGTFHLAQGVLAFPYELSPSLFSRLADSLRPSDDLARFYFFTGMKGSPLAGLHGEHLLVRANIEDEIGWDFGERVIVEDAYFALRFVEKYPGRSAFLNSCSYGASPRSIKDLIKQRKRWAGGLVGLVFDRTMPLRNKFRLSYFVANWTSGLVHHVGIILLVAYLLGDVNTSPIERWFIAIWCFNLAYQIWMYIAGMGINVSVSAVKMPRAARVLWSILLIPLVFAISAVEAWAAALGILSFLRRQNAFEVVTKQD